MAVNLIAGTRWFTGWGIAPQMSLDIKLSGDDALIRNLNALPPKLQRKYLRRGFTKAGRRVARAAKQKAPKETGLLRLSVGHRVYTRRLEQGGVRGLVQKIWTGRRETTGAQIGVVVGPRKGYRRAVAKNKRGKLRKLKKGVGGTKYRDPRYYAHLVEFGTSTAGAQPFLRPAFDQTRGECLELIREEVRRGLEEEARKAVAAAAEGGAT